MQAKRPGNSRALHTGWRPAPEQPSVDDTGEPSSRNEEDMVDRMTRSSKQTNSAAHTIAGRLGNDDEEVRRSKHLLHVLCFIWGRCTGWRWSWADTLSLWQVAAQAEGCVSNKNGKECYCPICIDIIFICARMNLSP